MNKIIKNALKSKGYEFVGESETRKITKKIEKSITSLHFFKLFFKKPIIRIVSHYTIGRGLTSLFTITQDIGKINLQEFLKSSPIKKVICDECEHKMYSLPNNIKKGVSERKICPRCHKKNTGKLIDDWEIGVLEVIECLDELININLLKKRLLKSCPQCFSIKDIDLINYTNLKKIPLDNLKQSLFCSKCKNMSEIIWAYISDKQMIDFWSSGAWLEWYIKTMLKSKLNINSEQGVFVLNKRNKNRVEVDNLFVKKKKIFSIECKALSLDKRAGEEVNDIIKLFPFSDVIIFITTSRIREDVKERYRDVTEGNLIFIEGKEIEDLPKILKAYF